MKGSVPNQYPDRENPGYELFIRKTVGAHEIGHILLGEYDEAHTDYAYGLMHRPLLWWKSDMRSYLHSGHIIKIRSGTGFDGNTY